MGLLHELNRCQTLLADAGYARIPARIGVTQQIPEEVAGRAIEPDRILINASALMQCKFVLKHELAHLYTYHYFPEFVEPHGEEFQKLLDLIS